MRPVFLSGFMATGKSTVGRAVAERLALPFVDTDALLEARAGCAVAELFRREGEAGFRERERALVRELLADPAPRVVAVGGGTLTLRDLRHAALEAGTVITLTARPETILCRVTHLAARPNLAAPDPRARIVDLLDARAEAYAECHRAIATDGRAVSDIADEVVAVARADALVVPLGRRSYAVQTTFDQPEALAAALRDLEPSRIVVVTDGTIERARHAHLEAALAGAGAPATVIALPAGEAHKTLANVAVVWDAALAEPIDRRTVLLAFGGGVVGDMGGFAASTLLRGLRWVQAPTTLLAMVDASVGGKTGFDHATGKNRIGTFFQPSAVVVDTAHLATLPARERTAGLAEVVKIALAADAALLAELEREAPRLREGKDLDAFVPVVRRSIAGKVRFVRDDELERTGVRAVLNLGHTVGHALEVQGGYRTHLHGEAVAIGLVAELEVMARLGWTRPDVVRRVEALLAGLGLPTRIAAPVLAASLTHVGGDKKREGERIVFPVVEDVGRVRIERLPLGELRAAACP
jgi:shikimate kinase/3-dehydroquinate synthase